MSQSASHRRPVRPYMAAASDPWALVLAGCAIALGLAFVLLSPAPSAGAQDRVSADSADGAVVDGPYVGQVAVAPGPDENQGVLDGVVFEDSNRNSQKDADERGIAGVEISNGSRTVTTDEHGRYEIPVSDGQTVFVSALEAWQVPVDDDGVAQFSYTHSPDGSPEAEQGMSAPTGPLPDAVDFPLVEAGQAETAAGD